VVDALTGVADVGELMAVEGYLDRKARSTGNRHRYGMALVDITGLRQLNEIHGAAVGDALLMELARRLERLSPDACVARVGGDEFAVLVDGLGADQMSQYARVIRRAVNREPFTIGGQSIPVHVDVTFRTGPSEHSSTNLLWATLHEHQVVATLEIKERLHALEKVADLDGLLAQQADLRTRLAVAEQRARRDNVTGLLNRDGYEDTLPQVAAPYAVAFVDVDNLRDLNKAQDGNWEAGDNALRGVSRVLEDLSPGCVVVRWGGDEFLVLIPGCTASEARDRLQDAFRQPNKWLRAGDLPVTCSGGVDFVASKDDHDRAMASAQEKTQEAKVAGRAQFRG